MPDEGMICGSNVTDVEVLSIGSTIWTGRGRP
jgi:hypothetical protein